MDFVTDGCGSLWTFGRQAASDDEDISWVLDFASMYPRKNVLVAFVLNAF